MTTKFNLHDARRELKEVMAAIDAGYNINVVRELLSELIVNIEVGIVEAKEPTPGTEDYEVYMDRSKW
jgi:prefoldin subunit 5